VNVWSRWKGCLQQEKGAVLVTLIAFVPVAAALMMFTVTVAQVFWARQCLQLAADMGALAGVQNIDLEKLAMGFRYVCPETGSKDAVNWATANMEAMFPLVLEKGSFNVNARVINPDDHGDDPVVHVEVEMALDSPGFSLWKGKLKSSAKATVKSKRN